MKASRAVCLGMALSTIFAANASAQDLQWQSLTVVREDGRKCDMRVPAQWTLQEKGATFTGPYSATLFYEAENPDVWWNKRKKFDLKDSRTFQDSKTNYWFEVQGALISGGDDGAVHIVGLRSDDLVCHAVLELKADRWRDQYIQWQEDNADMLRSILTSLKPH